MRQQPLTGFVLHQKPYRETRSLNYFFSRELGLVNGIGKNNLPLFVPISLFATGKSELKSFSQSQIMHPVPSLYGQAQFAGLYLNELSVKLLSPEVACEALWQAYQRSLLNLANLTHCQTLSTSDGLKLILRQFEQKLFEERGLAIDFNHDIQGEPILPHLHYRYQLQAGFIPVVMAENTGKGQPLDVFVGRALQDWQAYLDNSLENSLLEDKNSLSLKTAVSLLNPMGRLYRQIVDNLVNYQLLQSRELWQDLKKYQ